LWVISNQSAAEALSIAVFQHQAGVFLQKRPLRYFFALKEDEMDVR
jgi:hypothetical protein